MRSILIAGLALAAALLVSTAHAALPRGISGAWYNPAQPGHGLTIEMLSGPRALVFWHVFDPAGNPVHLYIEGDVVGHSIQGQAYLGHGMRFGSFAREDHVLMHWGEVTLQFDGCTTGSLTWNPDGPGGAGYTAGAMLLRRLTAIAGLECEMPVAGGLPAGGYHGTGVSAFGEYPVQGAVDRSGRLWVVRTDPGFTALDGISGQFSALFLGEPISHGSHSLAVEWVYPSAFMPSRLDIPPVPFAMHFTQQAGTGVWSAQGETGDGRSLALSHRSQGNPLLRPFDAAELAGARFDVTFRTQFFDHPGSVSFFGDGTLCFGDAPGETCSMSGRYLAEDPGLAMVSFELVDQHSGFGRFQYSGKAWLLPASAGEPARLLMAGRGHGHGARTDAGFAVIGVRSN